MELLGKFVLNFVLIWGTLDIVKTILFALRRRFPPEQYIETHRPMNGNWVGNVGQFSGAGDSGSIITNARCSRC